MQYTIQDIEPFDIVPGFHARMIHTDSLTIAFVDIEAGATLPEHAHIHEQITNMLEGELEMTIGGKTSRFSAGQSVVIPSNVPHSGRAITACKAMDVFTPVREDFRAKKVNY
jgi:quercetin dioxygenase-like cupin family protein